MLLQDTFFFFCGASGSIDVTLSLNALASTSLIVSAVGVKREVPRSLIVVFSAKAQYG